MSMYWKFKAHGTETDASDEEFELSLGQNVYGLLLETCSSCKSLMNWQDQNINFMFHDDKGNSSHTNKIYHFWYSAFQACPIDENRSLESNVDMWNFCMEQFSFVQPLSKLVVLVVVPCLQQIQNGHS